jgi:serine/threonine protein kinase
VLIDDVDADGDLIGRVLEGRWQIKERLGQGGMGTVFLATQQTVDRRVAVKMLKPALSATKDYAERFMREANVATSLNNPHCVTVYDFGQTHDGLLYLAMELLEGRALADVLQDQHLNLRDVLTVGSQICSALAAAHESSIVHRDLKPDNIFLVDVPGGGVFCKVLDFGIAKVMDTEDTPVTQTGQIFGTPAYMSPEQCQSSDVDQRSDLYSLGIILYELVSGRPPFYHGTPIKTLMAHVNSQVRPPSDVGVHVPGEFERIVLRLLEKEVDDRYQSALDVRRDIDDLMRDLTDEQLDDVPASKGRFTDEETLAFEEGSDEMIADATTARGLAVQDGDAEKPATIDEMQTEIYDDDGVVATETADRQRSTQTQEVSGRGWSTGLVVLVAVCAAALTSGIILWATQDSGGATGGEKTALDPNVASSDEAVMDEEEAEVQEPAVELEENSPGSIDREMQPSLNAPDDEEESASAKDVDGEEPDEPPEAEKSVEDDDVDREAEKVEARDDSTKSGGARAAKSDDAEPAENNDEKEKDEPSPALFENILTSASADRVIKSHYPEIRRCYQKGLAEDADFGGAVQLKMVVSDTGDVVNSKIVKSEVDHAGVENCIAEAAKTWTFPKPGDGFYKTLNHTFRFGVN